MNMTSLKTSGRKLKWLTVIGKPLTTIMNGDIMELKDIANKIVFVDYTINRAKIELFTPLKSGQMTKVIRFRVYMNDFGRYVFEIYKADEKYCTLEGTVQ